MMIRLVLLIIIVALASADPQVDRPRFNSRIVGGDNANIEDYPFQVQVLRNSAHICGGTIVGDKWIVTAAHCTESANVKDLTIRAGSSIRGVGGTIASVKTIIAHELYEAYRLDYDISVLELETPLEFGEKIGKASLPELNEDITEGTAATVTGWGTTKENGSLAHQLQVVIMKIVAKTACEASHGSGKITDSMLCAGEAEDGKGFCLGDAGGPLTDNGKLIGVVSWGNGCDKAAFPGVYVRVPHVVTFIERIINEEGAKK